jgi:hypothetical protein
MMAARGGSRARRSAGAGEAKATHPPAAAATAFDQCGGMRSFTVNGPKAPSAIRSGSTLRM